MAKKKRMEKKRKRTSDVDRDNQAVVNLTDVRCVGDRKREISIGSALESAMSCIVAVKKQTPEQWGPSLRVA